MRPILLAAAALCLVAPGASAEVAPPPGVGQVAFANSGAPVAQAAFQRGVAQLHNFQYAAAIKAFQEAQAADPGFAMAYWGEAMAHNHTVWMEQDTDQARAALAKLGPDRSARIARAGTGRERGFMEAVEALYGEGSKEQRDFAYSERMERLHGEHPKDVDVAAFYALSLLGLAHNGRDYGLYMRAAGVLEQFFPANQRHPGVVHYLIHSYDDPVHAPLGLRAARLYDDIAPDSDHAQHMTSHVHIALADWPATIDANLRALRVVDRNRSAAGRGASHCGHYNEWLHYSYLQAGEPEKAAALLASCRAAAAAELASAGETSRQGLVRSFASLRAQAIVDTGASPADSLTLDAEQYPTEDFDLAYGDLLLARGNGAALAKARNRLQSADRAASATDMPPVARKRAEVILLQAEALGAMASGRSEQGIAALRKAAEIERSMDSPYGPPAVEKPSFELLAEELAALGRKDEAAAAFAAALKLAPGRKRSLDGLALAQGRQPGSEAAAAAALHKH